MTGSDVISLFVLLGLASGVMAWIGLAGRLVATPPACGRCRFDLSGHEASEGGLLPTVCPECGLIIRLESQIRRSIRQRRSRPLRIGLAGLALTSVGFASLTAATGGTLDLYQFFSTPRLLRMAENGSPEAYPAVIARADADLLSREDWLRIAENAIREAEEPDVSYQSGVLSQPVWWRMLFTRAVRSGEIDRETAAAHAARLVAFDLELPSKLRDGEALPFRLAGSFGRDPNLDLYPPHGVEVHVIAVRLNGRPLLPSGAELSVSADEYNSRSSGPRLRTEWLCEGHDELPVLRGARPGVNTIEVDVRLTNSMSVGGGAAMISNLIGDAAPLPWFDVTVSREVEIASSGTPPTYRTVTDWDATKVVESSLSRKCNCGTDPGIRLRLNRPDGIAASAVAFVDVYVELNESEEWYLGNRRLRAIDSWEEIILSPEQAAAIELQGHATLRLVPTPWNAELYFERPAWVVTGGDVLRPIRFEDNSD